LFLDAARVPSLLARPRTPSPLEKDSRAHAAVAESAASTGALGVQYPTDFASFQQLYDEQSTVYRCATVIAQTVASTPLRFYEATLGEAEEKTELPRNHPIVELFRHVNNRSTTYQHILETFLSLELTGNAYWELTPKGPPKRRTLLGAVEELWHLRSERVRVVPSSTGIRGYLYEVNNRKIAFNAEEILHIEYPDPNNDWYGVSPLRAAFRSLLGNELIDKHHNAFLKNEARPSAVVMMESDLINEHQMKTLARTWEELYSGPENSGRTILLPKGRSYTPITIPPKDMELLETKKLNRDDIMIAYGVPPMFFNVMDRATFENARTQVLIFWENTVIPRMKLFTDTLNEILLPRLGYPEVIAEFDTSDVAVFRELEQERARSNATLIDKGVLTINEVRTSMGFEPVEWGDQWWGPFNLVPLTDGPSTGPAPPNGNGTGEEAMLNDAALSSLLFGSDTLSDIAQAVLEGIRPTLRIPSKTSESSGGLDTDPAPPAAQERTSGTTEGASTLGPVTKTEVDINAVLNGFELPFDHPELLAMKTIFKGIISAHGAQALLALDIGIAFNAEAVPVLEFLSTKTITFANAIHQTAAEAVRSALLEGMSNGENLRDLTRRVDEVFDGRKKNARAVARTETTGTANAGATEAYKQAGLKKHRWVAVNAGADPDTREEHADMHNEVRALNEPFSNGLMFPGDTSGDPASFINCRCATRGVVPGAEEASASLLSNYWKVFERRRGRDETKVLRQYKKIVEEQTKLAKRALREAVE
jgi:HK97 family phage portal protein